MNTSLSHEAVETLRVARTIAEDCQASQLNSAHLMLALLESPQADVYETLAAQLGVDPGEVSQALEPALAGAGGDLTTATGGYDLSPAPEVSDILALAKERADQQATSIELRHLCMGLGSVEYGPVADASQALKEKSPPQERMSPSAASQPMNALGGYGVDLTELAAAGKLLPVVNRDNETQRVIECLGRMQKNNPVLIGAAGVGKTAIVEGLAQRVTAGNVPGYLRDATIFALDTTRVIAGASMHGEFEQRMQLILNELQQAPTSVILFVDELHSLMGLGSSSGLDAGTMLKPLLARGGLQMIGATTADEYRHIERDRALERRLIPILVDEPTRESTLRIVQTLVPRLENHHGLPVDDSAVEAAVDLSFRYLPDRRQPDKAIDAIDQAAASCRAGSEMKLVEESDVRRVISESTGIPLELMGDDTQRLMGLEAHLKQRVVGQDEALEAVASCIRRNRCGLSAPNRPWGSFLFLGGVGVGKTLTADSVAEFLFGHGGAITKIDLGEYAAPHSTARLIGSPPGYVGYDEGGQLTEKVRRRPYQVILFDELDKAHHAVQELLLGVLEGGQLTDGQGSTVDFSNTVIILTANVATEDRVGFGATSGSPRTDLGKNFIPELLNRLDRVVQFQPLSSETALQIAAREFDHVVDRLANRKISLVATDALLVQLAAGFNSQAGARPIRNLVEQTVANLVADAVLTEEVREGDELVCDFEDESVILRPATDPQ